MSTLTIQLFSDEELAQWEKEATAHGFGSAGEYILHLARENRPAEQVSPELQALLEEGENSGEPILADDAFWQRLHEEVEAATEAHQPV